MAKCLVVDDDEYIAELVSATLKGDGHEVTAVSNGQDALESVREDQPDLVVLDVEMPMMDGHETAARMRQVSDTRILMLTARTDASEKVVALTTNVDDYMTKPFTPAELRARVAALLRRDMKPKSAVLPVRIDQWKAAASVDGQTIPFTQTEFEMFGALLKAYPNVVKKRDLIEAAWGDPNGATEHTLDVHMHRVRAKLEGGPVAVASVRGVGFRLLGP